MSHPIVCRALVLIPLAACADRVPANSLAEPQAIERAIKAYYERHASEENQTCLTPYIDGLARVAIIDEQPDRLVLDARYLYRDRFKDDRSNGIGRECTGYAAREFTLTKEAGELAVVAMGPSRRG
jgi:hypothetical protein